MMDIIDGYTVIEVVHYGVMPNVEVLEVEGFSVINGGHVRRLSKVGIL